MKKNRKLLMLSLLMFCLVLLAQNQAVAQDPGEPDTVYFSCGSDSSADCDTLYIPCNGTHDVKIQIQFYNDESAADDSLVAISIPLVDVCFDPASFAYLDTAKNKPDSSYVGSRLIDWPSLNVNVDEDNHAVLYGALAVLDAAIGPGNGLFATMTYTVRDTGRICLDSTFFPPSNRLQFVTKGAGGFTPVFRADTFVVAARNPNAFPVLTLPADVDTALVAPQTLCIPGIQGTDSDAGDLITLEKIEGPGTFDPNSKTMPGTIEDTICFMPENVDSTYMFVFKLSDQCPAEVYDTFYVTVNISEPPVLTVPEDVDTFLCAPQNLCIYDIIATDNDAGDTIILEKIEGPGTFVPDTAIMPATIVDTMCFLPADVDSTYRFIFRVTDPSELSDEDTFYVTVDLDDPPALAVPADVDTCLPPAQSLCIKYITATDPNSGDSIILEMVSGSGTFVPDTGLSPITDSICFDPASNDSTYEFVFKVTDSCDSTRQDTFYAAVNINQPPALTLQSDTTIFLCEPETLCFDLQATDPDADDTLVLEKIAGPGTFVPDTGLSPISDSICFEPTSFDSTYTFIFRVTDPCGEQDEDTFRVTVDVNVPPAVTVPSDTLVFRCEAETLCFDMDIYDPDNPVNVSVNSPWYYQSSDTSVCFYASSETTYPCTVIVTDSCNVADTGIFTVTINLNEPPMVTVPADTSVFLCQPQTVCFDIDISDPDNPTDVSVNSPWSYEPADSSVCVYISSETTYRCTVIVTDSCGVPDTGVFLVTLDLAEPPVVTVPADTSIFQCEPETLCFRIEATDPDAADTIILEKLEGPGIFQPDTGLSPLSDSICFLPADFDSTYRFIFRVKDPCPGEDYDTFYVTVGINEPPLLALPEDVDTFLCEGQNLCIHNILATDANADDTLILEKIEGPGVFVPDTGLSPISDSICFTPETFDSTYRFVFRVTDQCGVLHEDTFYVTVDIDDPPALTVPSDLDTCLSPGQSLCIAGIVATDPNLGDTMILEKVSGPGTFVPDTGFSSISDTMCFDPASKDSTYEFVFKVTDSCDSTRQDTFYVSVNINRPPVLLLPEDADTFLCQIQAVCFDSIMAFDPDSEDTFVVTMIQGLGTFDPDTGTSPDSVVTSHCFTPVGADSVYRFIFEVNDPCGETDQDTFDFTVGFNHPPLISGPDTLWVIRGGSKTDTLTAADPDSNMILDSAGVIVDPDCGEYSMARISNSGGASGQWEVSFTDTGCLVDTIYTMLVDLRDTIPGTSCPGQVGYDAIVLIIRSQSHYNNVPLVFTPADASGFAGDPIELIFAAADPDSDVIVDTSEVFILPSPGCGNTSTERLTPLGEPSGEWKVIFYTDGCLPGNYEVQLNLQDALGAWGWNSVLVELKSTDVPDTPSTAPAGFALEQNYPNPFNQKTGLSFEVPYTCRVSLNIYNLAGQLVNTLVDGETDKGKHTVFWDGTNLRGDEVASGIYFYKLTASDFVSVRKMILLK